MITMSSITTCILNGFEDQMLNPEDWSRLLVSGNTDTVFLTLHWQKTWWKSFGRGNLLLTIAKRDNKIIALAPLFSEAGMVFFVGSGGSDYLDFIGDIDTPLILQGLLKRAREQVPDFLGFRFYHILDNSPTGRLLQEAAQKLHLVCFDEGSLPAPILDLSSHPEVVQAAVKKKSLVRYENLLRREGNLTVKHLQEGSAILPHLDEFFDQHIARWEKTPYPSLFREEAQRKFYKCLTLIAAKTGWLRFMRLDWEDRALAFHYGFSYKGNYMWYKPSFAINLAHKSPGTVLLRQLLLCAIDEDAKIFDFGIGDEAFKQRFATNTNYIRTWGLYPVSVLRNKKNRRKAV